MINNNNLVRGLFEALQNDLQIRNHYINYRANRYQISILEKEILSNSQSLVFVYKLTDKYAQLEYYCPLTGPQHRMLSVKSYAPLIRSGKHLSLRLGKLRNRFYAVSMIRFPLETGAGIDFMAAMTLARKELERLLEILQD